MTKTQIEEFSKLELMFLESATTKGADEQLKYMELIFFWLKKQINFGRMAVILSEPVLRSSVVQVDVTEVQKRDFSIMQMSMVQAVFAGDSDGMIVVEQYMRSWIDEQISAAAGRELLPNMRIIRKN